MSFITVPEIINSAMVKRYFSTDNLCEIADRIEHVFIKSCIGKDTMTDMSITLQDWKNVIQYQTGSTHAINDLVYLDKCVYKSLENANTEIPGLTSTKWVKAKKFTEPKYDELWKTFLRPIIATKCAMRMLVFNAYKSDANGTTKLTGMEGIATVTRAELMDVKMEMENMVSEANVEMIDWIIEQNEMFKKDETTGYDFSLVKFIKEDCEPCVNADRSGTNIFHPF